MKVVETVAAESGDVDHVRLMTSHGALTLALERVLYGYGLLADAHGLDGVLVDLIAQLLHVKIRLDAGRRVVGHTAVWMLEDHAQVGVAALLFSPTLLLRWRLAIAQLVVVCSHGRDVLLEAKVLPLAVGDFHLLVSLTAIGTRDDLTGHGRKLAGWLILGDRGALSREGLAPELSGGTFLEVFALVSLGHVIALLRNCQRDVSTSDTLSLVTTR